MAGTGRVEIVSAAVQCRMLPRLDGVRRAFGPWSARLLRFGFADHCMAAQAFENVEIGQVLS